MNANLIYGLLAGSIVGIALSALAYLWFFPRAAAAQPSGPDTAPSDAPGGGLFRGAPVRVHLDPDGGPFLVARDVFAALGYSMASDSRKKAYKRLGIATQYRVIETTGGQMVRYVVLTFSQAKTIVAHCDMPAASHFMQWLVDAETALFAERYLPQQPRVAAEPAAADGPTKNMTVRVPVALHEELVEVLDMKNQGRKPDERLYIQDVVPRALRREIHELRAAVTH